MNTEVRVGFCSPNSRCGTGDHTRIADAFPRSVTGMKVVVPADLIVRSVVSADDLDRFARETADWPEGSHVWGHYAELTPRGPTICRTENVSACHRGLAEMVDGPLRNLASERLGRRASAFKDKINYKQPGGAGFRPHQDQAAYPNASDVVSLLIAIDECTLANGCLWVSLGIDRLLPTDPAGVIDSTVCDQLDWHPIELGPGDGLVIAGLTPHWSDTNHSDAQRRVMVASYSPSDHRYRRADYYAARAELMQTRTELDGRFRISTIADFAGVEVPPSERATVECTHA